MWTQLAIEALKVIAFWGAAELIWGDQGLDGAWLTGGYCSAE